MKENLQYADLESDEIFAQKKDQEKNPQAPIPALRKDNFSKAKILFLLSYEYNMFFMRHE